ncbi:methyl-accepting chemotaxis protein [Aliiglaciecola lipolytica]|uniref:Methyl-accepting chemotaxis protein n=1 Tax=Aliiglaciecola lipolytica E3 TaxID=1127673 RepID=K6YP83_9ALTE|nr:methyl-accepting chemotaxis protein [Aliiglaciecola lipolytica]GAC13150.1 methyl-accepting chemotaxis protein [Aliiglaciecola lipolytica E3]
MKISVAMRVIGGFALISVLLLVIGVSSLLNFNSIDSATEEVNTLAIPTLNASNQLKISFLNMGRLTVAGFYETESDVLDTQFENLKTSKDNFESEVAIIKGKVSKDPILSGALQNVDGIYQQYSTNVEAMFESRKAYLDYGTQLDEIVGNVEDNADDSSTLLLDFSDLDSVQENAQLRQAAEVGSKLETSLLSLLTVSADYIKTQNLVRADTIGNEVELVIGQVSDQLAQMQSLAGDRDDSGTLQEITNLVNSVISSVTASDGLLNTQVTRLNKQIQASEALTASEANIQEAIAELNALLSIAEDKTNNMKDQVSSRVAMGTTVIVVMVLVSAVLAAWIAWASVRAITVPLRKVNEVLHIVSSGDLTRKLDDSSDDEFGELASSVNNLIESLKTLITGISTRASQLAAASEETSTVTAQTTHSIQNQKSQVAQVAAATTEMHSTSQMVTQSAEDTLNQIRHADKEAEKVKGISLNNKLTIEKLAIDVDEAANVINKLHQDSASIGGILDVIRGVADQTNLLALNAAIEAARAGEQGRGFAVVADEVRTLASRTQQSTQEINAMIEVLQAGAEKAVTVMNQGKEQTTVCVEQTEKATQALDLITEAVHRAHDVSSQIEQSAREQNVVSQEISEKLENIVGIAEETSTGAQQTADSSEEVARLAEELQASIQQFRV